MIGTRYVDEVDDEDLLPASVGYTDPAETPVAALYVSYASEGRWEHVHERLLHVHGAIPASAAFKKFLVRNDATLHLTTLVTNPRTAIPDLTEQFLLRAGPLVRPVTALLGEADRAFIAAVSAMLSDRLTELASTYAAIGQSIAGRYSASQLADRMAATLPEHTPWADVLGPCFSHAAVAQMRNTSPEEVNRLLAGRQLLGIKTSDGVVLFPEWQFDESSPGHPRPEIGLLLSRFPADAVDDLTIAGWLKAGNRRLSGMSPLEWLDQGRDIETADAAARAAAARLSQ